MTLTQDERDLIRSLADHVGELATRVERAVFQLTRIANASEDTNAMALTQLQETRAAYERVGKALTDFSEKLAVVLKKTEDAEEAAEDAAREATGAHRLVEANAPRRRHDSEDSGDRRDPWYSRLGQRLLRTPPTTLIALALLIFVAIMASVLGVKVLQALDHSHVLQQKQEK